MRQSNPQSAESGGGFRKVGPPLTKIYVWREGGKMILEIEDVDEFIKECTPRDAESVLFDLWYRTEEQARTGGKTGHEWRDLREVLDVATDRINELAELRYEERSIICVERT